MAENNVQAVGAYEAEARARRRCETDAHDDAARIINDGFIGPVNQRVVPFLGKEWNPELAGSLLQRFYKETFRSLQGAMSRQGHAAECNNRNVTSQYEKAMQVLSARRTDVESYGSGVSNERSVLLTTTDTMANLYVDSSPTSYSSALGKAVMSSGILGGIYAAGAGTSVTVGASAWAGAGVVPITILAAVLSIFPPDLEPVR